MFYVDDFKVSEGYQKTLELLYLNEDVPSPIEEKTGRVSFMKLALHLSHQPYRNNAIINKITEKYNQFEDFRCVVFTWFKEHNWYLYDHTNVPNKYIVDGDNGKTNQ
jgi:hypothetical protein